MKILSKLIPLFLFFTTFLQGQNLIPNPSFEDTISCPINMGLPCPLANQGSFDAITFWTNPVCLTSPDLYNSCINDGWIGVPNNWPGYQLARTGNSYAGIYAGAFQSSSFPSTAEYICSPLTSPLIAGNIYTVSFYVSCGRSMNLPANLTGTNGIGAFLSQGFPDTTGSTNTSRLYLSAQINNPVTTQITDTTNWVLISDTMTAIGGENYITIGTFLPDSLLIGDGAYLYVDDVSVESEISVGIESFTIQNQDKVFISPNPSSGLFLFKSKTVRLKKIEVFNILGEIIYQRNVDSYESEIDLTNISRGLFEVLITTEKGNTLNERIIVQ
jgi:hypothetical protein